MSSSSRPRRKFTSEFKAEAVAMVEASGGQIGKVAKELGIYDSSLGNWVRQAREEAAGGPSAAGRAGIRGLRRELERVTRERDILGKASLPGAGQWWSMRWGGAARRRRHRLVPLRPLKSMTAGSVRLW